MDILQHYHNQPPRNEIFFPRKLEIPEDNRINLHGVRGSGKTALILDYILNYNLDEVLYIDYLDPNIRFNPISPIKLQKFILDNSITLLIIDNYTPHLDITLDINKIIIISRVDLNLEKYLSIKLFPLDYEEFLVFEKGVNININFNHFLKLGTLPVKGHSIKNNILTLKNFFEHKFTYQEQSVLIILAIYQTKRLSINQLYLHSKERFKISKDWFYAKIKEFEREGIIYFFNDIYQKGGKKMILFDFAFGRYLAIGQPFITQFDTMVAISLIKHQIDFKTLGIYGYLTIDGELITPAPFESEESILKKSYSKFSLYKKYNIKKITILTVTNQYSYNIGDITFEAMPFYEWSVCPSQYFN